MADTVVSDNMVGADRTARLDMALADTLTVETNALFSVTANKQTVRFERPQTGQSSTTAGLSRTYMLTVTAGRSASKTLGRA